MRVRVPLPAPAPSNRSLSASYIGVLGLFSPSWPSIRVECGFGAIRPRLTQLTAPPHWAQRRRHSGSHQSGAGWGSRAKPRAVIVGQVIRRSPEQEPSDQEKPGPSIPRSGGEGCTLLRTYGMEETLRLRHEGLRSAVGGRSEGRAKRALRVCGCALSETNGVLRPAPASRPAREGFITAITAAHIQSQSAIL